MILLINLTDLKNEIWNEKIIVSIKLASKQNAIETLNNGIQKGDRLYTISKNDLDEMIVCAMNNGFKSYNLETHKYEKFGAESIVIVAIPDILHKQVFDIDNTDFINFKSQFDYENNENGIGMLDELAGYYSDLIWEKGEEIPVYYIPSELILGYISFFTLDKENVFENIIFTENPCYFTKLNNSEQKNVIQLIKKTYVESSNYSKYCSLIKKKIKK